jgi:hypothetical protein
MNEIYLPPAPGRSAAVLVRHQIRPPKRCRMTVDQRISDHARRCAYSAVKLSLSTETRAFCHYMHCVCIKGHSLYSFHYYRVLHIAVPASSGLVNQLASLCPVCCSHICSTLTPEFIESYGIAQPHAFPQ